MAQAKKIYILMIKVRKLLHVPRLSLAFYSVIDSEQRSSVRWGLLLCVFEVSVKKI